MQALILAAGMGKRLGEYTKDSTKCMVKINGECLIDRVIKQLLKHDFKRIVLVVGYKGKKLIEHIGNQYGERIEYIENPIYNKTNNIYSLWLARDVLSEDDTILLESDIIFEDCIIDMLVENPYPNLALVDKYQTWMDGTMVQINGEHEIVNFIPKDAFNYNEVDEYYKTVNIYKFSKDFSKNSYLPFLDAYCKVMGNNEYYEQVLRVITLLQKSNLHALPLNGQKWYEIDDVQDLDIASNIFSDEEKILQKYHKRYGGYWRFPHLLDFCYLVNPYFPTKRMKDEMCANFDQLLTNYPSGMEVNSLLAGKYFGIKKEYVVVGNGAAELIKSIMEKHIAGNIGVIFPTFEEYPNRLDKKNIIPFIPQKENYRYGVNDLITFFATKDISTLLLINPDNPSGNFIASKDIFTLIAWCKRKHISLIVDESFVDFADDSPNNSLLHNDILEKYKDLVVIKSISKSYGVPGLRLGVACSSDIELTNKLKKELSIWNINSFGEFYMQLFGKYSTDYQKACELFREERKRFYHKLQDIPYLKVFPSQANFFLCEIIEKYTSDELGIQLLKRNILISNCNTKSHIDTKKQFIRIAIRDQKDNNKLISALKCL